METPQSNAAPGFPTESPATIPSADAPVNVEMVLRVWAAPPKASGADSAGRNSVHNPGLISFIEDIVAARQGTFRATRSQLSVTGLKQASDALVIARQIQFGLQGFRGKPGVEHMAVSIAVDASSKSDSLTGSRGGLQSNPGANVESTFEFDREPLTEPSHDLLTLLKLSKPSQILVTHGLCERSAAIKSLPLKSFPARFGVYEYLWTAPEKLDLLQSEPQLTLATVPPARPLVDDKGPQAEPEVPVGQSESAEPAIGSAPTEQPPVKSKRGLAEVLLTPRFAILGAIALVAIAIASFVGVRMARESAQQSAMKTVPSANPGSPGGTTQIPLTPANPPPLTPPGSNASGTSDTKLNLEPSTTHGRTKEKRPATTTALAAECDLTGSGQIPTYLTMAEQARGRGDYVRAIRLFRKVQDCEPNNAAAKEGLARSIQGQEQSRRAQ